MKLKNLISLQENKIKSKKKKMKSFLPPEPEDVYVSIYPNVSQPAGGPIYGAQSGVIA